MLPASSLYTMQHMHSTSFPHKPRRERLALTLLLTIVLKCLVLYGLWYAFFSHPPTRHMLLPAAQVESHLFSIPARPGFSNK
jgi:hypothetical protein